MDLIFWYHTFIDFLALLLIYVLGRHCWFRLRYYLHVFQLTGYKRNEYRNWLRDTGKEQLIPNTYAWYIGVLTILFFLLSNQLSGSAAILIVSLYGLFWFLPQPAYMRAKAKKPLVYTARVGRLLVPLILLSLVLPIISVRSALGNGAYMFDVYPIAFGFMLTGVLIPWLILPASLITQPIENYIQEGFKKQAREKLKRLSHVKVIAITGSYGKTSTKFMIRDLLKERFSVCTTPGSYNTPMGICKVINNDLTAQHQVLILEMGARYVGNIDELCEIAQPDISVVTNVGVAHLETFGSQQAIADTKSSIVRNLKKGGTAVLNVDDSYVRNMRQRRDITYITIGQRSDDADLQGTEIRYNQDGCRFKCRVENQEPVEIQMPVLGEHNVQNMLLAMGVGKAMGMRLKTMQVAARRVEQVEHRLELKQRNGYTVIDDAFNSNPIGARNAVNVLNSFEEGRKIIITPGMVELGDIQARENRSFGEHIGRAGLDLVILVGKQQTKPILEGIQLADGEMDRVQVVDSLFEANDLLADYVQNGDVVLYENDLPDTYNE
ncbi:MAG: UDP-N-acetylmuramoyl-tripeptide--D-alanyl-D-alanine ligase [Bacteroidota bacterium]